MALIACGGCGEKISSSAMVCPKCGHPNKKANHLSSGSVLFVFAVFGAGIWWLAGGGFEAQTERQLKNTADRVANDFVNQYEIAKRNGDAMQICVQAGIVSAAFLQAKDESNYQTWKKIEKSDCRRAGLPRS